MVDETDVKQDDSPDPENPITEEVKPQESKPTRQRASAKPEWLYVYRENDGYHFVGLRQSGSRISGTESEAVYATAQQAKRAAKTAYPELRIIQ